jgi:hypothetical protein
MVFITINDRVFDLFEYLNNRDFKEDESIIQDLMNHWNKIVNKIECRQ